MNPNPHINASFKEESPEVTIHIHHVKQTLSQRLNRPYFVQFQLTAAAAAKLKGLLAIPENQKCADCGVGIGHDCWASINIGMFICLPCSGIHRNLGVHITKVK